MNRSLDENEINKLIAFSNKQTHANDSRVNWPGRENTRKLAQAVKERKPFVHLSSSLKPNRRFSIRYTTQFKEHAVFVNPDDGGFVPCGYFNVERLENVLKTQEGLEDYAD